MVSVMIMSLRVDPQPDLSGAVVPLRECESMVGGNYLEWMEFSKYNSNELLVVVSRRVGREETESRFMVIDVESTYQSKSLVVLSETRLTFKAGFVLQSVLSMTRKSGSRCFVVKCRKRAAHPPVLQIMEVEATSGAMKVLIENREKPRGLYHVSDSRFCASLGVTHSLCQIWDCSNGTSSLVTSVLHNDAYVGGAMSGFIFTVGTKQLKEVKMIEASSGVVVLSIPFPAIYALDGCTDPELLCRKGSMA
ncbi:hypothetical protein Pelo_19112 [Pelomyxa schiedti]|nr:hypothetical protein Pelo_19112 [Pelomyxa schiedti]